MPTTTNFGWTTPADTDLVKDGALAIRTLGNGVDTSLVDLKGGATGDSLVKASATDLDYNWTRLADQVLVNPVINGGMDIWQRGTSIAGTASTTNYVADRWVGYRTGATFSRQTTSDTTNLPNIQYSARAQRDSGNTSVNKLFWTSSIESVNSRPFIGKAVTFSFYAKCGANYSSASSALTSYFVSGTGTDQNVLAGFTGATSFTSNVTLTTTWQRFVITGTVPATATQLGVGFEYTPVGTAGANDWFEVTGVQIDVGTFTAANAPTFRRSGGTIQGELAACQRYYWRMTSPAAASPFGNAYATSTTAGFAHINYPVEMRTSSGVTLDYSTIAFYLPGTAVYGATTATISTSTRLMALLSVTGMTGLTANRPYSFTDNNSTSGYIGISAEL